MAYWCKDLTLITCMSRAIQDKCITLRFPCIWRIATLHLCVQTLLFWENLALLLIIMICQSCLPAFPLLRLILLHGLYLTSEKDMMLKQFILPNITSSKSSTKIQLKCALPETIYYVHTL